MALFGGLGKKLEIPTPEKALPGREARMPVPASHFVTGQPLDAPFDGFGRIMCAMGCFWGAERKFWEAPGVISTSVGYVNGSTPNPTYEEVCSGRTGHTEALVAIFDPAVTSYEAMLRVFWENHDPTQGMRQGNDVGTQYRSGIYVTTEAQRAAAEASKAAYGKALAARGYGADPVGATGEFIVEVEIVHRGAHDFGQVTASRVDERAVRQATAHVYVRLAEPSLDLFGGNAFHRESDDTAFPSTDIKHANALDVAEHTP